MEDVRKVGDYTVLHAMYIGHKEIVLCENADAKPNERYLCCYVENIAIFERYSDAIVSDDFAELVKEYGTRITEAAAEIIREMEKANADVGSNEEITPANCKAITYEDSLVNKVVVIRGDILRPEFRHASRQLMLLITNDGRKLALDQRLMNDMLPDSDTSKVSACADNVFSIWEKSMEKKSTQIAIFSQPLMLQESGKISLQRKSPRAF